MNNRAFTLIEVMVVIALIGILSAIGTYSFSQYSRKAQMQNQTRILYGDLMEYRAKALYQKKNWAFKISATGYGIYSSYNTAVAPVTTTVLKHAVESDNAYKIYFNSMGVANISTDPSIFTEFDKSVCIFAANDAVVDSVVISPTRVQIGKKGASCAAATINPQ